jgi:hypothetical protein
MHGWTTDEIPVFNGIICKSYGQSSRFQTRLGVQCVYGQDVAGCSNIVLIIAMESIIEVSERQVQVQVVVDCDRGQKSVWNWQFQVHHPWQFSL